MGFNKIELRDIPGFRIGNAEDRDAATGCTVILCEQGAVAGVDVRGGGPATRETDLLRPENTVERIHAVVLSGGSAYGLEAASGVMRFLEQRGIGFAMGDVVVPVVSQAALYDLAVGSAAVRPDREMGEAACTAAYADTPARDAELHGNRGAGTGASVGKCYGMERAMKSGLGTFACSDGTVSVGAIAAVNAYGDVYNGNNNIIAGVLNQERTRIKGTLRCLKNGVTEPLAPEEPDLQDPFRQENLSREADPVPDMLREDLENPSSADPNSAGDTAKAGSAPVDTREMGYDISFNTTISCLITNAALTKAQANKLASILHDGYARAIKPVHSSLDGDTIFVMSTGEVAVNFDAFAALATDILQYSIIDAAQSAEDAYGLLSAASLA